MRWVYLALGILKGRQLVVKYSCFSKYLIFLKLFINSLNYRDIGCYTNISIINVFFNSYETYLTDYECIEKV